MTEAGQQAYGDRPTVQNARRPSSILVVTTTTRLGDRLMEYVVGLAARLGSKVLAAYIQPHPLLWDSVLYQSRRNRRIDSNAASFRQLAAAHGVSFEHIREAGRTAKVIGSLCQLSRRIEFVVIDDGIKVEDATAGAPVPVFRMTDACNEARPVGTNGASNQPGQKDMRQMPAGRSSWRNAQKNVASRLRTTALLAGTACLVLDLAAYTASYAASHATGHAFTQLLGRFWVQGGSGAAIPVITLAVGLFCHGLLGVSMWKLLIARKAGTSATPRQTAGTSAGRTDQRLSGHTDQRPRRATDWRPH